MMNVILLILLSYNRPHFNVFFYVDRKSTSALEAIVVQIKILMDIPEQMWSSVDNNNLLQAAQLFLLARYVNYNLKFEIGEEKLTKSYSVVNKQWRIISQFKDVIFKSSDKVLKSADLTIEVSFYYYL